ncbi:hypothetical protein Tco_0833265 [Tanacetum coccineum]
MSPKSTTWGQAQEKPDGESLPKCNKCHLQTTMARATGCHKSNKIGALCSLLAGRHFKRDCPKLKNKDGGKWECSRMGLCSWECRKEGKCTRKPHEANVFHGLFSTDIRQEGGGQVGKETNRGRTNRPRFSRSISRGLAGLPPARPVEFQIDLVPGAAPVARAPYRFPIRNEGIERSCTAKFSQCELLDPEGTILDNDIDSRGIHVDTRQDIVYQRIGHTPKTPTKILHSRSWLFDWEKRKRTPSPVDKAKLWSAPQFWLYLRERRLLWYTVMRHTKATDKRATPIKRKADGVRMYETEYASRSHPGKVSRRRSAGTSSRVEQSSPHFPCKTNLKKCYANEPLVMPLEGIHIDD